VEVAINEGSKDKCYGKICNIRSIFRYISNGGIVDDLARFLNSFQLLETTSGKTKTKTKLTVKLTLKLKIKY